MEIFQLAFLVFDLSATFFGAISGAILAARRGFDILGVLIVAIASSTSGGLLRDGLFLQDGPPRFLQTPMYLGVIVIATLLVWAFGRQIKGLRRFGPVIAVFDALGIGAYAVVGMNLAVQAGLPTFGVIVVGMVNAVGGNILRDILIGEVPQLLKPGVLLGLATLIGCIVFVACIHLKVPAMPAGIITVVLVFVVRMVAVQFRLETTALKAFEEDWRKHIKDVDGKQPEGIQHTDSGIS